MPYLVWTYKHEISVEIASMGDLGLAETLNDWLSCCLVDSLLV